jgi:GntR family transcriptional regulator
MDELLALTDIGSPLWKQIEEGIRLLIASRRFRPGDAVPSVRQLGRMLSVTPNTVERAYRGLIGAGVLVARRGKGTFVSDVSTVPSSPREQMLEDAAARYATMATAVGAPLQEALGELAVAYKRLDGNASTVSRAV